jgi:thioredoxin 1
MIEVTDQDTFNRYIQYSMIVVVDFYATWCGPCKMLGPKLDELSHRVGENIVFIKVNVDNLSELAERYEVSSLPTVKIFHNTQCVYTSLGFNSTTISNLYNELVKY